MKITLIEATAALLKEAFSKIVSPLAFKVLFHNLSFCASLLKLPVRFAVNGENKEETNYNNPHICTDRTVLLDIESWDQVYFD